MLFACCNGAFLNENELRISPTNRNFLYGDGLFETVRSIEGKPIFISQHVSRLQSCMQALQLTNFDLFTETFLNETILRLNELNRINAGGRARILIFRNEGGTYMPLQNTSSFIIRVDVLEQNMYELNATGLSLGIYNEIKKPLNKFAPYKTCNSLLYVLASVFSQQNNFSDCLILNEQNNICEATSSNVFWVTDSKIFTTPLSQGCVSGVLRTILLEKYSERFSITEKNCSTNDLLKADEIFLTNSIGGFRWVKTFMHREYGNSLIKNLIEIFTRDLHI